VLARRTTLLLCGLALYGLSLTLLLRADLGLDPWDVFHQGLADTVGWSLGTVIVLTSFAVLALGVVGNGVATGMYIGAGMGPGPRDGLMTGIARRRGTVRVVRTAIELTVLATGIVRGGTFGIGTIVYAVAIGPLAHIFLPIFTRIAQREPGATTAHAVTG